MSIDQILLLLAGILVGLALFLILHRIRNRFRLPGSDAPESSERAVEQTAPPIRERPPLPPDTYYRWMNLTEREKETARLIAQGKTTHQVADILGISPATVQTHVKHAFNKLDVHSRIELIRLIQSIVEYDQNNPDAKW